MRPLEYRIGEFKGEGLESEPVAQRTRSKSGWGGARPGAGRKPSGKERKRLSVDFDKPDFERLEEIAEEKSQSVGQTVRDAVSAYLRRFKRK